MKKRFIAAVTVLALALSLFSGCSAKVKPSFQKQNMKDYFVQLKTKETKDCIL